MIRPVALFAFALGIWSAPALAQPAAPKAGDTLSLSPADWPKQSWLMGAPSASDAAGKVVVHWFCTPKHPACVDDLARVVTMRDTGNVYIVAYINASTAQAKKMDPIRESEGVGRGTVASGTGVRKLFKQLGVAKGPMSIVVDLDGKVQAVTTSGDPNELDARDAVVKQIADGIKAYTTSQEGAKTSKAGEKMTFALKINLAKWLKYSNKVPTDFSFTAAKEIQCDKSLPKTRVEGQTLIASVTCTAPKGSYQVRGDLRFGYESPSGGQGLGSESASWSFEVKP